VGLAELRESIKSFGEEADATKLNPCLDDTDPDDVFSTVPYEKGYTFLYYLEEIVGGGEMFEPFFKDFIQTFAGASIDSEQFKDFTLRYFENHATVNGKLQSVDWEKWLRGTGMPPYIPKYDDVLMVPCKQLAADWIKVEDKNDADRKKKEVAFAQFSPAQKAMFLDALLVQVDRLSPSMIEALQSTYQLNQCTNVEVLLKWFLVAIRSKTESVYPDAAKFATQHGRMKYCRPVLRELFRSGPLGKELALKTFKEHRSFYHPIAAQMISKDLQLS
jgi:leukotriene-A4 hydrolase